MEKTFAEGYAINTQGEVISYKRGKRRILAQQFFFGGEYLSVGLSIGGKKKRFSVHRHVAEAFIPNPQGKPQVNHINGVKTDNRVENLEWMTPEENIRHAFDNGLRKSGCEHFRAKFTAEQVREIRRDCIPCDPRLGFKAFARKFNVTSKIIRDAYHRKSYLDVE